jgi:hypothetical protein
MKANIELFKRASLVLSIALLSACGGGGSGGNTGNLAPAPAATGTTGTVTYFTTNSTYVPISLSFDNSPAPSGTITAAFVPVGANTLPVCGTTSASAFSKTLTLGTHNKNVVSPTAGLVWTPTVNVVAGCSLIQLL